MDGYLVGVSLMAFSFLLFFILLFVVVVFGGVFGNWDDVGHWGLGWVWSGDDSIGKGTGEGESWVSTDVQQGDPSKLALSMFFRLLNHLVFDMDAFAMLPLISFFPSSYPKPQSNACSPLSSPTPSPLHPSAGLEP